MVPVARKYEQELLDSGVITEEELKTMQENIRSQLESAYVKSKTH